MSLASVTSSIDLDKLFDVTSRAIDIPKSPGQLAPDIVKVAECRGIGDRILAVLSGHFCPRSDGEHCLGSQHVIQARRQIITCRRAKSGRLSRVGLDTTIVEHCSRTALAPRLNSGGAFRGTRSWNGIGAGTGISCDAQAMPAFADGKGQAVSGVGERVVTSGTRGIQIPAEYLVEKQLSAKVNLSRVRVAVIVVVDFPWCSWAARVPEPRSQRR